MSAPADRGVHRLFDIVVEEVSLVDRAANQHRFLIVKRSQPMDENTDSTQVTPDGTNDTDAGDTAPDTDDDVDASAENESLATAVAALESLTQTVEALGGLAEEEARPHIEALAAELRTAAERLSPSKPSAAPPPKDDGNARQALDAVRAALARFEALVQSLKPAESAKPPAPATPPPPDPAAALRTELTALNDTLRSLAGTVKQQQGRLGRLEKHFGLPNSAPPGEHKPGADDPGVGWPLDLNRPLDRASVEPSVSFHDV
jgi:hypothetical protein